MSTRILFADDSMTAQNMGKKILTEAGYEVVAVSNGAAAVKKIAEQKPDIIILDIYMPGYTGLEVCDKVRASVDTLKTPVLLTVGKMEPYRAEDANRVKADGVIIKPFEASDLLAVIKKLEERVVPKTVAMVDKTIRLERLPDFEELPVESPQPLPEMHVEAATNGTPAIVDVPDNMATSAAFSDLLGPEPTHSFDSLHTPAAELPLAPALADEPAPASFSPAETAVSKNGVVEVPEFTALPAESAEEWPPQPAAAHASEFTVTPVIDSELKVTHEAAIAEFSAAAVEEAHSSAALTEEDGVAEAAHADTFTSSPSAAPAASWPDTQPIPVYREPEPQSVEVVAPSAAATTKANDSLSDVAESASKVHKEQAKVAAPVALEPLSAVEPAVLAAEGVDFDTFNARVDAQIREIETMVAAAEAHSAAPGPGNREQGIGNRLQGTGDGLQVTGYRGEVTENREQRIGNRGQVENGFANPAVAPAEDDFEARVAAAMSIYEETVDEEVKEVSPSAMGKSTAVASAVATPTSEEPVRQPESLHTPPSTMVSEEAAVEAPYSFEYSPGSIVPEPEVVDEPVAAAVTPEREISAAIKPVIPAGPNKIASQVETPRAATVTPEPVAQATHPVVEPDLVETPSAVEPAVPIQVLEPPVTASSAKTPDAAEEPTAAHRQSRVDDEKILSEIEGEIEAQLPAASAANTHPGLDTQVIASAVHRVLERLKPHLIEEIARELKNNRG